VSFAKRLVYLRRRQGLTQAKLAEKLCISRSCLSGIESGRRDPNLDTLIRLADYFDVSVDYLLGRSNLPILQRGLTANRSPEEVLDLIASLIKQCRKDSAV